MFLARSSFPYTAPPALPSASGGGAFKWDGRARLGWAAEVPSGCNCSGCGVLAPAHDGVGLGAEAVFVGSFRAAFDADPPMFGCCLDYGYREQWFQFVVELCHRMETVKSVKLYLIRYPPPIPTLSTSLCIYTSLYHIHIIYCIDMDSKLTGEKLNEERAFIKRYTDGLGSHKVEYPEDFSTPLSDRPRKVAPVQVS